MNSEIEYSYPVLSNKDYFWVRIGGPGLANCLFIVSQAYIFAALNNKKFLSPTWIKFSIGPWIRKEKDKRFYNDLFKPVGISGLKKIFILLKFNHCKCKIKKFATLGNYFTDLFPYHDLILKMLDKMTNPKVINLVNKNELKNVIAVHIRLGDYPSNLRINIRWYEGIIDNILKVNPSQKIYIFSDGTDEELDPLMISPNIKRVFYGNALADIMAISKCKLLIASDSTFSAWGAFIGKVPIIFSKRHFPSVFQGEIPEYVIGNSTEIPNSIKPIICETDL